MEPLFTCRYGSHLYGTSTPQSDIDVKVVHLPSMRDLLLGRPIKNTRENDRAPHEKSLAGDRDIENIPLQVFAHDFLSGQTYAQELAHAVEYTGAMQQIHHPRFRDFCRELRSRFMTSEVKAMTGYAVDQASRYSFKGTRLKAVEAVQALLSGFPMMDKLEEHAVLLTQIVGDLATEYPNYVAATVYDIGNGRFRPCIKLLEKVLPFTGTFEYNLKCVSSMHKKYGHRAQQASEMDGDWKAIMHAVRVIYEGITLLSGKPLVFPFDPETVEHLLEIKRGERGSEDVFGEIDRGLEELNTAKQNSPYPESSNDLTAGMEEWLVGWLEGFYGLGQS